jgi:hypothetical protein
MSSRYGGRTAIGGNEINVIDLAALVGIPWFAATIFGVFSFSLDIFGGYNFTDPIWTIGGGAESAGVDISVALLAVLGLTAWILVTNEIDGSDYQPEEFAVIAFAFLAPIMFVFVPSFESLVMWNDISQLFFTLLVSVAATWISYAA